MIQRFLFIRLVTNGCGNSLSGNGFSVSVHLLVMPQGYFHRPRPYIPSYLLFFRIFGPILLSHNYRLQEHRQLWYFIFIYIELAGVVKKPKKQTKKEWEKMIQRIGWAPVSMLKWRRRVAIGNGETLLSVGVFFFSFFFS